MRAARAVCAIYIGNYYAVLLTHTSHTRLTHGPRKAGAVKKAYTHNNNNPY
nr:MAG TPA: hypothetical protein [Caudoviricetes sp.]